MHFSESFWISISSRLAIVYDSAFFLSTIGFQVAATVMHIDERFASNIDFQVGDIR